MSGTSRGRCFRRRETPPAAARSAWRPRPGRRPSVSIASASAGRLRGGRVHQQHPVALLFRKQPHEVLFRHHQLALEDAVGQRRRRTAAESGDRRASGPSRRRATCAARRSSSWHRRPRESTPPGSGCARRRHGFARSAVGRRERALEREPPRVDEPPAGAEDARIGRLVEVEATGIVARQEAERLGGDVRAGGVRAPRARRGEFGSCTSGSIRLTSSG